jgi:NAD(P)-dependent dehydrogenase (short-subunit alcohol dehydrogenase family)
VNRVTGTAIEELGRIDILVNNAGITERKPFLEIERKAGDPVMAVNPTGRGGVVMA